MIVTVRNRCAYCGFPIDGGNRRCCKDHKDLPAIDPDWEDFVSNFNTCIHCGQRTRMSREDGVAECGECFWLVRFTRDEILEMARGLPEATDEAGRRTAGSSQ